MQIVRQAQFRIHYRIKSADKAKPVPTSRDHRKRIDGGNKAPFVTIALTRQQLAAEIYASLLLAEQKTSCFHGPSTPASCRSGLLLTNYEKAVFSEYFILC
jgi:hypothetical protein